MAMDIETRKFYGMIVMTVEREFGASVYDDVNSEFRTRLHQEYLAQGKPKNARAWIKTEIRKHFLCVGKPPVWSERMTTPRWPFFAGKPMIFIEQVTVPDNELTQGKLSAGAVVYIFGARKPVDDVPGGWEMIYSVVEQVPNL
jgi:hypothetical protein